MIKRKPQGLAETKREYRDQILSFTQDESGTRALRDFIGKDNKMSREGMYLLEILNNLIQSENGSKNVFQRIPQEVFGGLSEGGRRNVEASLITRAVCGTGKEESRNVKPSGYTGIQEAIGTWAERDGSWSDTPEGDLKKKGYLHDAVIDGSEARIFDKEGSNTLYKTIDFSHYSDFELMMDRIAIHNSVFPEMPLHVMGFGIRDDATDNTGFVVIVSQPKATGVAPTQSEIEASMKERFFDRSENGFFYINGLDNIVVADIHGENAVKTENGNILVFDCEAFLKTFKVDNLKPERVSLESLLPKGNGRWNDEAWEKILGSELKFATDQERSEILRELRTTGKYTGLIDGKTIVMETPQVKLRQLEDGRTQRYYDSRDILVGEPSAFSKEHIWTVPELQFDEQLVNKIKNTVKALMPMELPIEQFLYAERYVGQQVANRYGGGEYRKEFLNQLKRNGHIEGLVNDNYIVQVNPMNPENVLIADKRAVDFMLWTHNHDLPSMGRLTETDKTALAAGETIEKNGKTIRFDLDKGRIDEKVVNQRKLTLKKEPIAKTIETNHPKKKPLMRI